MDHGYNQKPSLIIACKNFFSLADSSEADWEHTVSWVDCANRSTRGLFIRGDLAQQQNESVQQLKDKMFPFTPPVL